MSDGLTVQKRGEKIFFAATVASQVLALLRYMLLVRALTPEQLGYAALLILVQQFFDSITDGGADRFIVQDEHGDKPKVEGLLQLFTVLRGILVGLCLIIFAGPISQIYDAPVLILPLMILSFSPLIFGFINIGTKKHQRSEDFRAEGLTVLAGEVFSFVCLLIGLVFVQHFAVVLVGLIGRSVGMAVVSNFVVKQPMRIDLAREHLKRFAAFAAPLMINGAALFIGGQGDRVLIGAAIDIETLGVYTAVVLLIFYPMQTLRKYIVTTQMAALARRKGDLESFDPVHTDFAGQAILLAALTTAGYTVVGPLACHLLFGAEYTFPLHIMATIAVLQTIRFVRMWPAVIALVFGRSQVVMWSNIVRLVAFPFALLSIKLGGGLFGFLLAFIAGEVISFLWNLHVLRGHVISARPYLALVARYAAVCAATVLMGATFHAGQWAWTGIWAIIDASLIGWIFWCERSWITHMIDTRLRRLKPGA